MDLLEKIQQDLSELKKQRFFEFTASNERHISRGSAYAITKPLQEKFKRAEELRIALEQKQIPVKDLLVALEQNRNNLADLQAALKEKKINLDNLELVIKPKGINLENLLTTLEPKKIDLEDLQTAFETNYHIIDKKTLSFILLCLVEPVWLPGTLPAIVLSLLSPVGYFCSNNSADNFSESILQVHKKADGNSIEFCFKLIIKPIDDSTEIDSGNNTEIGSSLFRFSIDTTTLQVKFLPITLGFEFPNNQDAKQFQQKLAKNFKGWLLKQSELDYIPIKLADWRATQLDFWVFSTAIGLLIGLSAMISLIALCLTPISPLLLPPIGLALGLGFAGFVNSCIQINIKKEQTKTQRPIYLYNEQPTQTTTLFNYSRSVNSCIANQNSLSLSP
jgi:hypothetical protein